MPIKITMPQLGESVTEGTLSRWLKKEGERVAKYEPLVEVITDKVNTEIPSPAEGVLARITVPEGQTVQVGTEIAVIEPGVGARVPGIRGAVSAVGGAEGQEEAGRTSELPPPVTEGVAVGQEGGRPAAGVQQPAPYTRHPTSPLVRRLAREHGVDLTQLPGSGLGGRVTKEDIERFIAERAAAPVAAFAPVPAVAGPAPGRAPLIPGEDEELVLLTPIRRTIAQNMVRSVQTIPHAWTMVEADVTNLVRLRERMKDDFRGREGVELTYVPFAIKALVEAVKENPSLNASWRDSPEGGAIVLKRRVNVGVAVGMEDGLVVPVIKDADQKSIAGLAHALRDLVRRARSGELRLDDVQGGTITLNNTGAFGSVVSHPIVVPGQAAILTLEAIQSRPVAIGDAIAVRSIVHLCLSFDHRIVDGVQVGRFMQAVKQRLEAFGPDTPLY